MPPMDGLRSDVATHADEQAGRDDTHQYLPFFKEQATEIPARQHGLTTSTPAGGVWLIPPATTHTTMMTITACPHHTHHRRGTYDCHPPPVVVKEDFLMVELAMGRGASTVGAASLREGRWPGRTGGGGGMGPESRSGGGGADCDGRRADWGRKKAEETERGLAWARVRYACRSLPRTGGTVC